MRILVFAATAATLFMASAAVAAPASVKVAVGPALQTKAERVYGLRDVQQLTSDLQRDVERRLARTGAYDGARIELTLTDAVPNRPTFKQLADTPGLSMRSFGLGGASIEGRIVGADGQVTPVSYRFYETDIRNSRVGGVWSDADWTFAQFAAKLSRGEAYARR